MPDYLACNQAHWKRHEQMRTAIGLARWEMSQPVWGQWAIPESELALLPAKMDGMSAVDLGCGTGYVSGWMSRRGATVVGVDSSIEQLKIARRLAAVHGVGIELIAGQAENVPIADGSMDFAISEFGAATWSDPFRWIPEAARLLRPGGELAVLSEHPFLMICVAADVDGPATDHLVNSYFDLERIQWDHENDRAVNFNLPLSGWMALFRRSGFEIIAFHEIQAPDARLGRSFHVTADWAHRWPSEQVWRVRRCR